MPIIVSRKGKSAQRIDESGVPDEDYLQQYIEDYPDALPLDDIRDGMRLMILDREFQTRSGRIDVLAIDDEGGIYLIETKRFENPDRRRVIAQVLDYGAALWWEYSDPSAFISELDRLRKKKTGKGLDENITEFFGFDDEQLQEVRDEMQIRIREGNFKFIILMDTLEDRLKNIIQFMNERTKLDIYAVEMEFYRHEGIEIVIPKLFEAQVRKTVSGGGGRTKGRKWDEDSFFSALGESGCSRDAIELARDILGWVNDNAHKVWWGKGAKKGSFGDDHRVDGLKLNGFAVWTSGGVEIYFHHLAKKPQFSEEEKRLELRDKLNDIEGVDIPRNYISKLPRIPLEIISTHESRTHFVQVLDWLADEMRARD